MGQLHELLPVEGDAAAKWEKVSKEAINTFSKKPHTFLAHTKTLKMFEESRQHEEELAAESKALDDTVQSKLDYIHESFVRYIDIVAQKETTNQTAAADLEVDGEVILARAPATFLLGLETKLKYLRGVYSAIPTLAPGREWELDPTMGEHVYKDKNPEVRSKTEQQLQHKVLYEAKEKHPAQIEKWMAQVPVGKITSTQWSGMLSVAEKSKLLGRIDKLLEATKRARQRANKEEVNHYEAGQKIVNYIHG